jgi:hypothetical protein
MRIAFSGADPDGNIQQRTAGADAKGNLRHPDRS